MQLLVESSKSTILFLEYLSVFKREEMRGETTQPLANGDELQYVGEKKSKNDEVASISSHDYIQAPISQDSNAKKAPTVPLSIRKTAKSSNSISL